MAIYNYEYAWVAIFVILTWSYLSLMAGCTPYRPPIREDFEIKTAPSHGRCKTWWEIEEERSGQRLCGERRVLDGNRLICNRKLGHAGGHHMHGLEDCYWIW